jgi:pimeloyl-CoA synthetase
MYVNIRDNTELKVYQTRNNSVKDKKGDLVADSSVLRICRRITCQQLNIYRADNVRPFRKCLHFEVVGELEWSNDPESYAGGSVATGRVSFAGKVKGDDPD